MPGLDGSHGFPDFHDIPCAGIARVGENFVSENPLGPEQDQAVTGMFVPFGTPTEPVPGEFIRLQVRQGPGAMPAFSSEQISREQLDDLIAYLIALRRLPEAPSE